MGICRHLLAEEVPACYGLNCLVCQEEGSKSGRELIEESLPGTCEPW